MGHVPDRPKVKVFCASNKERVHGSFFFTETTITGIVYLDKLQQVLIPQLDEDYPFTSSKTVHPLITLEKCASTPTPVSLVGGLVERRR
jgi:hypothetical protein